MAREPNKEDAPYRPWGPWHPDHPDYGKPGSPTTPPRASAKETQLARMKKRTNNNVNES